LSSSESEEFALQILGFSGEVNGRRTSKSFLRKVFDGLSESHVEWSEAQGPFASQKSTKGASKLPESEGEKSKA
jgi:hypothetical protein